MLRNLRIFKCTIQVRLTVETEAQNPKIVLFIFKCACKMSKNCNINSYLGLAAPTQLLLTRFWPAKCLLNMLELM